jgi:hypothetical protein
MGEQCRWCSCWQDRGGQLRVRRRYMLYRPVDELAAPLQKTIGRDLSDDERRQYGVPDWVPGGGEVRRVKRRS